MVLPLGGTEAIEAMGVLPSFAGVAVHDAWAPYDTYTAPDHQLCCAHALRELQAVTDAAAGTDGAGPPRPPRRSPRCRNWSPKRSARSAAVDPDTLDAQIHLCRSAGLAGASQTAARSGPVMKKHHALARRLLDYLRFPPGLAGTTR